MSQSESNGAGIVNPLAERLRSGGIGLSLMIKHARTVDIALAAKTCGFGSSDLSADLGVPGQNMHPRVLAALERVVAACRKHGKIPGMRGLSGGDARPYEQVIGLGARFFSAANEWALMMAAGEERVRTLRALPLK